MIETEYCSFCGWEDTEPWIVKIPAKEYGTGPDREDQHLCQFCYRSYSVSQWLAGLHEDFTLAKDMMAAMNFLRSTLLNNE